MKNLFCCLILLLSVSCCKTQRVYYEYDGITVTRIDYGATSRFYYGKYENNKSLPQSYIETWPTGGIPNGGKEAFIMFREHDVALYCPSGGSVKKGEDSSFILYGIEHYFMFDPQWWNSIEKNYNNIARITYFQESELASKGRDNSLVEIIYSTSK